jgi:hypothetical protein
LKKTSDPISRHAAPDKAACAPFREERRLKCVTATKSNRKYGRSPSRVFCSFRESVRRIHIRPMYAGANWGTHPVPLPLNSSF